MMQMTLTSNHDVHVDGHPTCACGQELDTCRRSHCPRCGHRLPTVVAKFG